MINFNRKVSVDEEEHRIRKVERRHHLKGLKKYFGCDTVEQLIVAMAEFYEINLEDIS